MTLRFTDSFDHYATANILAKYNTSSGSVSVGSATGRRGTGSLRLTNSGSEVTKTFDNQATWIVGFSFKASSFPSISDTAILTFRDGGTAQCDLRIRADGTLRVTRSSTTLATSTNALATGTTYYIEMKVVIHDTTGTAEVRVNGSNSGWINATGLDTKNTANTSANVISLSGSASTASDFDDLYICDGAGSANNDFLGDIRVDWYSPNGNGNSSQLTGSDGNSVDNYLLVDEAAPNDDTDYVESSTVGQQDTYSFPNMAHTPTNIYGMQLLVFAKKSDAGLRSICTVTRSGGADTDGATQALSTSYTYYREVRETDPATSAAWTQSGVNNAQIGEKVAA